MYNATALETDKTLTVSGAAADAMITGNLKGETDNILNPCLVQEFTNYNGVTLTLEKDYLVMNGVCTASSSKQSQAIPLVAGEKYTVTIFSDKSVTAYVKMVNSSNIEVQRIDVSINTPITFTVDSNTNTSSLNLGGENTVVYNNTVVKIQIKQGEFGDTFTSYYTAKDIVARNSIEELSSVGGYYVKKNLFDGNYVHGKYISGSADSHKLEVNANYYAVIMDVEPNTKYSIINPIDIGKEDSYYWFKVSTDTTYTAYKLISTTSTVTLNGSVFYQNTSSYTPYYQFTTGTNDKSVVILASKYQQPYLEVLKGDFTSRQYNTYKESIIPNGIGVYSKKEVNDMIPNQVWFSLSNGNFTVKCGKLFINFKHRTNAEKQLDTYMIESGALSENGGWVFDYDVEGPIQEYGVADFVGGGHGYEQYTNIVAYADGELLDLTGTITKQNYNEIVFFVISDIYHYGTTTKCFTRCKSLRFHNNEVEIHNIWKCVDDFNVTRYTGHGLMPMYCDIMQGYCANNRNEFEIPDDSQTIAQAVIPEDKDFTGGTFFGTDYSVTIEPLENNYEQYEKGMLYGFYADSRKRLKFYFDAINVSPYLALHNGDELRAGFKFIFR